jgi:tripartite-type tricarboxylate transporter receptor subunit TctC
MDRISLLPGWLLCAAIGLGATAAGAQGAYPTKSIRVIVPFSPGASDAQIRALGPLLSAKLGQAVVVENMPGAGGSIAANRIRAAAADGHTLLFTGTSALTMLPALRNDIDYRLGDFTPIAKIATVPGVMVARSGLPITNMRELVTYAKKEPGKLNFASSGVGTAGHTMGAGPQAFAGFTMTHIPYKGGSDMLGALLSGTADVGCFLPNVVMAQIQAGKLVPLAVTTSTRSEFLPEVPTYKELGIPYEDGESYGLLGPKGLPDAVVQKLAKAVGEAVNDPGYRDTMRKSFTSVQFMGPAAYQRLLQDRARSWHAYLSDPRFLALMRE